MAHFMLVPIIENHEESLKFNTSFNISGRIWLKNRYFNGLNTDSNCIFNESGGDFVITNNLLSSDVNNGFFWSETEITDPIKNCEVYCRMPFRAHFNVLSDVIIRGQIPYFHYVQNNQLKNIRSYNRERQAKLVTRKNESTMIALISNCIKWRLELLDSLEDYFNITKEGHCFGHSQVDRLKLMSIEDLLILSKYDYSFSVENSKCPNYVSEKLHKAILVGIIPVIYDLRYLPEHLIEMSPYILDTKDLDRKIAIPDEMILVNYYSKWKNDFEVICDHLLTKGIKSRSQSEISICESMCTHNQFCH